LERTFRGGETYVKGGGPSQEARNETPEKDDAAGPAKEPKDEKKGRGAESLGGRKSFSQGHGRKYERENHNTRGRYKKSRAGRKRIT